MYDTGGPETEPVLPERMRRALAAVVTYGVAGLMLGTALFVLFRVSGCDTALRCAAIGVQWDGESEATFSDDGRRLAFVRLDDEADYPNRNIFVLERANGRVSRVTDDCRADREPVWLPNGRLAFERNHQERWIAAVEGDLMERFAAPADLFDPDWARDGRIVWSGRGGLVITDGNGRRPRTLRVNRRGGDQLPTDPAWAPDGRRIAFALPDVGIVLASVAGGEQRLVAHAPRDGLVYDPVWSPDGSMLAYTRHGALPRGRIHVIDLRTDNDRPVSGGPADYEPTWVPDGTAVVFTRLDLERGAGSLYEVRLRDGEERPLGDTRLRRTE